MTRGELSTRIQARLDRYDSTTQTEIDDMINEVIRRIEQSYALAYNKKSQEAVLTANSGIFTLPATLIYHHPFDLLLENTGLTNEYDIIVKTGDHLFNQHFTDINKSGAPEYFRLTGGANSNEFQLYPVQTTNRTIKIGNGYFYSGDFTADAGGNEGDTETTWLTEYFPNLIIEGSAAELFRHYGELDRSVEAQQMYQVHMNGSPDIGIIGLLPTERRRSRKGRLLRAKTLDDFPLSVAKRGRTYGA